VQARAAKAEGMFAGEDRKIGPADAMQRATKNSVCVISAGLRPISAFGVRAEVGTTPAAVC